MAAQEHGVTGKPEINKTKIKGKAVRIPGGFLLKMEFREFNRRQVLLFTAGQVFQVAGIIQ